MNTNHYSGRSSMWRQFAFTLFSALLLAMTRLPAGAVDLIPATASWRYQSTGTDLGTAWRNVGYDDSGWSSGPALLGFGDPDIATTIGSPANGVVTYYFRYKFIYSNNPPVSCLQFRLTRDDGAAVYLNGAEIRRSNLPGGTLAYGTRATTDVDGPGERWEEFFVVPGSALVTGENIVAVEVHQSVTGTNDAAFRLRLQGDTFSQNCNCTTRGLGNGTTAPAGCGSTTSGGALVLQGIGGLLPPSPLVVAIRYPHALGGRLLLSNAVPAGVASNSFFSVSAWGNNGQMLGRVGMTNDPATAGWLEASPNFAGMGSQTFGFCVYMGNTMAFQSTGRQGYDTPPKSTANRIYMDHEPLNFRTLREDDGSLALEMKFENGLVYFAVWTDGVYQVVMGDRVEFYSESGFLSGDEFLEEMHYECQAPGTRFLMDATMTKFGREVRALGDAHLIAYVGQVTVGMMSDSGNDGAEIEFGGTSAVAADFSVNLPQTGAWAQAAAVGYLNNQPGPQTLASLVMASRFGKLDLSPKFSALQSTGVRLEAWSNNVWLASFSSANFSSNAQLQVTADLSGSFFPRFISAITADGALFSELRLPSGPAVLLPNGQTLKCDTLRWTAVGGTLLPPNALQKIQVTAQGTLALTLTGAPTWAFFTPPCPTSLLVNGSFEQPVVAATSAAARQDVAPGSGAIANWQVLNHSVSVTRLPYQEPGKPSLTGMAGEQALNLAGFDLSGHGVVQQSVPTVPGLQYQLSFLLGVLDHHTNYGGPIWVVATAGSASQMFTHDDTGSGMAWRGFTLPFTAVSSSTTVTFSNVASKFWSGLDGVCVTPNCIDIYCPTSPPVAYTCSNCTPVRFTVSAANRCNSNDIHVVYDRPSNFCYPLGITWVTATAFGSGQTNQCSFPVTVLTNCPPPACLAIHCPTNAIVQYTCSNCAPVTFSVWGTNYCNPSDFFLTTDAPTNNCFPPGTTTVHVTGYGSGQSIPCQFNVTVLTNCPPPVCLEIHCPTNLPVTYTCSNCAPVYFSVSGSNHCNPGDFFVTTDAPTNNCFPLGPTTVTATGHGSGQTIQCQFTVLVLTNNCPPPACLEMHCPSNVTAYACGSNCTTVAHGAWAENHCNLNDLVVTYSPATNYCFPPGQTWVTVTAVGSGQTNSCTFTVTVLTNCAPVIVRGWPATPLGGTTLVTNVSGGLVISPLTGPAPGAFRLTYNAVRAAKATFAETVAPSQQNSNVLFGVTVFGTNGLSLAQVTVSNWQSAASYLDVYAQLPSSNQPPRHTLRVWKGANLVQETTNRPPPSAINAANHLLLNSTPTGVSARLDENGRLAVAFSMDSNPALQGVAAFDTFGNGWYGSGDLIEFISETVLQPLPTPPDILRALEFQLRLPQTRTLTDVVATKFGHDTRGFGRAQLTGQPGRLRVDIPSAPENDGVKFDLGSKSSAEVEFELPVGGNVTQQVVSVSGDSGALGDLKLTPANDSSWSSQFDVVADFNSIQASSILVEAMSNGVALASSSSPGEGVFLTIIPAPGTSAIRVGAQINADGSMTRSLSLNGTPFTASLLGAFQNLGPLEQVRFTSVGNASLPPGAMKHLSVRGQTEVVGYMNITGLTSSDLNPFHPVTFMGNAVSTLGNATFAHNENGDLIFGNLSNPASSNGVRLDFGSAIVPRSSVEFQFDRTVATSNAPVGAMFHYAVESDSGTLDSIDGTVANAGNPYIAYPTGIRTVRLYLNGSLFLTDASRPSGYYLAPDSQPSKVSVRLQGDGSIVWTFTWPSAIAVQGFISSYSPRYCDKLEIVSAPNLVPPGTSIRAVQIASSGIESRTLLTPPPVLSPSLSSIGGTLGLQFLAPLSPKDRFIQEGKLAPSGGKTLWNTVFMPWTTPGAPTPSDLLGQPPVPRLSVPVKPTVPSTVIRTFEMPPSRPGECVGTSWSAMDYFLNLSSGWRVTELWNGLGNPWGSPWPGEIVLSGLMNEADRLTSLGYGPTSAEQQFTQELLGSVVNANPGALATPAGSPAATFATVWEVVAGSPSGGNGMNHPFGSIHEALTRARAMDVRAVELRLHGNFNETFPLEITCHTRMVGESAGGTRVTASISNDGSCDECDDPNIRRIIEARAPFRLEIKNVSAGSGGLTVHALGSAFTLLDNVVLNSVTHEGIGLGERRGTLIMQNGCLVKNSPGWGVTLTGGASAFLSDCTVSNCHTGGLLLCSGPTQRTNTSARLLRSTIVGNGRTQSHVPGACWPTAGAVVVSGNSEAKLAWCRVAGNRGPAVVASGSSALACLRFCSIAEVLPFNSAPVWYTFGIGLGAYQGGSIKAFYCDLSGSSFGTPQLDWGVQVGASGGSVLLEGSRVQHFTGVANDLVHGFVDHYCSYPGEPLPIVNTSVLPTPVP